MTVPLDPIQMSPNEGRDPGPRVGGTLRQDIEDRPLIGGDAFQIESPREVVLGPKEMKKTAVRDARSSADGGDRRRLVADGGENIQRGGQNGGAGGGTGHD